MRHLNRVFKRKVKLFWSTTNLNKGLINFGDALNPHIVEKVFGRRVDYAGLEECELIALGSIIQRAEDASTNSQKSIAVWGSGFLEDGPNLESTRLQYHAVRGKMTQSRLPRDAQGTVLGDPGLLASEMVSHKQPNKKYDYCLIPHYVDKDDKRIEMLKDTLENHVVIDVFDPPLDILETINSSRAVISSGLHGLIVADALSIPNVRLKIGDRLLGGDYKFDDYYSVYKMETHPMIDLTENEVSMKEIDQILAEYQLRDGLEQIKSDLIKSFPL